MTDLSDNSKDVLVSISAEVAPQILFITSAENGVRGRSPRAVVMDEGDLDALTEKDRVIALALLEHAWNRLKAYGTVTE
jgi:hypothetical protein